MNILSMVQASKQHRRRRLFISAGMVVVVLAAAAATHEDGGDSTTVILVRHAEKAVVQGDDPPLSETGRKRVAVLRHTLEKAGVSAIYATQYLRTQQTVEPLAKKLKIAATKIDAAKTDTLVAEIRQKHRGETVLVAGHSNTIPEIIKALGASESPAIADGDFDDLFVVTLPKNGPVRMIHLQYGEAN